MNRKCQNFLLNNKGQALVEFVLILPIFIFLLFSIYDFGMIFNKKNSLENQSTDIINLYKDGQSIEQIKSIYKNINIKLTKEDEYDVITITDKIKLITPGFNKIFANPYKIQVVRYLPNEQ